MRTIKEVKLLRYLSSFISTAGSIQEQSTVRQQHPSEWRKFVGPACRGEIYFCSLVYNHHATMHTNYIRIDTDFRIIRWQRIAGDNFSLPSNGLSGPHAQCNRHNGASAVAGVKMNLWQQVKDNDAKVALRISAFASGKGEGSAKKVVHGHRGPLQESTLLASYYLSPD